MTRALLIGGTGFFGRHAASEFRAAGYDVAVFARGEHAVPDDVTALRGDRTDRHALEAARDDVDPDVVVDLAAMSPADVEAATAIFGDAEAYVYVSSASAYAPPLRLPSREDDPLNPWTDEQATDGWAAAYGARKAEGDRRCFAAADDGANAMVVRPVVGYGPGDWSGRHDYWFDRVRRYDRVVVPGDGDSTFHRVFAPDVATALRLVAERGTPGEAYNVAERDTAWLDRTVELAAAALDTGVDMVHAGRRELASVDLVPTDFPLYSPVPRLVSTERLAALGWESTPVDEAIERTVAAFLGRGAEVRESPMHDHGVDRETEEALIDQR